MILYALACDDGHRFESWFRDSGAYDEQRAGGLLACPICSSCAVAKTIMSPALMSTSLPESTPAGATATDVALVDEKSRELRALLNSVRDKLIAEGHDVGVEFAAEARRMHDGVTPMRQIYGQASPSEARDLIEEGIMVLPMPTLPDDLN